MAGSPLIWRVSNSSERNHVLVLRSNGVEKKYDRLGTVFTESGQLPAVDHFPSIQQLKIGREQDYYRCGRLLADNGLTECHSHLSTIV